MLGWISKTVKAASDKAAQDLSTRHAEAVALENLKNQIDARFRGRIFIAPPEAYDFTFNKDRSWIDDEDWKRWEKILKRYPMPPRTQSEALRNEASFWHYCADILSVEDRDGRLYLRPHATILLAYEQSERWILREYYAATGKIIEPSIQESVRLYIARSNAEIRRGSEFKYETLARNQYLIQRLNSEIENYNIRGQKDHFERWGNWFVTHVEDAFNRAMNAAQQKPRSTKLGDGGFADLDEINGGQSSQSQSTPRAQSQIFKD